ncbi:short-chain dehydrogenase [Phaffia rhodozyma]|uniref:Short-chain dehydrogenase n=1 Tax=Phaffia rhodozyma TaxID=264483 RepID=A0A0F7SEF7_PHARH|nr:short-chain dehydrogenase [Phaffia rhodozyma]
MQSVLAPLIGPTVQIPPSLVGRTAIVTGGALGIGYEISRALAKAGARTIMINRKEEQGDSAIAKIKKESPDAVVEWVHCDLGNMKEVKSVFGNLERKEDRLDLLVLDAGININTYGLDSDGIERHMGVNWFGHFLAINTIYPLIRRTSKLPNVQPPRIVFESSELHRAAPGSMKFADMKEINDESITPLQLYGRTKAAMILGAKYGIVEKVIKPNGDNIWCSAVHPGTVITPGQDQWKDAYGTIVGGAIQYLGEAAGMNEEQGSYSAIWALTNPEVIEKGWNGYYFSGSSTPGKETAQCSDPEIGDNLWNLSHQIVREKLGPDGLTPWDKQ